MIKFIGKEEAVYCLEHVFKIIDSILNFILKIFQLLKFLWQFIQPVHWKISNFPHVLIQPPGRTRDRFRQQHSFFAHSLPLLSFSANLPIAFLLKFKSSSYFLKEKIPPRYILRAALASCTGECSPDWILIPSRFSDKDARLGLPPLSLWKSKQNNVKLYFRL